MIPRKVILILGLISTSILQGFTVDTNLPAGNAVINGIDGDRVKLHQDMRVSAAYRANRSFVFSCPPDTIYWQWRQVKAVLGNGINR